MLSRALRLTCLQYSEARVNHVCVWFVFVTKPKNKEIYWGPWLNINIIIMSLKFVHKVFVNVQCAWLNYV